ncbi:hypothetical protein GGR52DRAFT_553271 [Hypoxylon sp. FL1284]|nr:hypothetical protein GGR52DRAFT_553271 [Hypoxylon sp. FL1284]
MMVGVRRGARSQAEAQVQARSAGEELAQDDPDSQSSDDDDEDIPYVSPHKPVADPTSIPLDHRRRRNREPDHDQLTRKSNEFKRRKIEHLPKSPNSYSYLTPDSSTAALPVRATRRHEQKSSSPEDAVPAGLLNSVNAALKSNGHDEAEKEPKSPERRSLSETEVQDNNSDQADRAISDHQDVVSQESESNGGIFVDPDSDLEDSYSPDIIPEEHDDVTSGSATGQDQIDVWDVPLSPQKVPPPSTARELPPSQHLRSKHSPERTHSSSRNNIHATEDVRTGLPSDDDDELPDVLHLGAEPDEQQEEQRDEEDMNALAPFEELSTGDENLADIDLSAEDSFAQDVTNYGVRHPGGYKGTETFESPSEDDNATIHIGFGHLKKALKLMSHRAWAGLKGEWYTRSFNYEQLETGPVRALLQFLAKLERLLEEAPKAPHIAEQNAFLGEHSELIGYYFSKIKLVVHHIREMAKETPKRAGGGIEKYDKMFKELVSHAAPMLLHVMASAWFLGGDHPQHPSFTISALEFLRRTLGWIEVLYRPMLRGLQQEQLNSKNDEPKYRTRERLVKRTKREELEEYLKGLRQGIEFAVDGLERKEQQRDRERLERGRNLERQAELQAQQAQDEKGRTRSIEEKKWRSLMSLRGIHIPLSESSMPPSIGGSPKVQSPSPSQRIIKWSLEEERLLFREIQKSYPKLPDFVALSPRLDRTLEDVEATAERLLGLMLEAVWPNGDAADRAAHIKKIMDGYRLSYSL